MSEKDIVQAAIEEKIIELEVRREIMKKACTETEKKLSVQTKELLEIMEDIGKCKNFLREKFNVPHTDTETGSAAEQEGQTDGREEGMTPEAKSEYDKARYKRKKEKAAEDENNAPKIESMDEILAKAKEAGLSYGQYLTQRDIQRQSEEMAKAREERRRKKQEGEHDSKGILGKDKSA